MRNEAKDQLDPSQAALIVTYGNTSKKCRPLDTDLIVLGRNPGCDMSLVSPEVAPIHCVLARVLDGWRLRDCSGRPGTRVNGKPIQDVLLADGDTIQVGAFSFQAHLPEAGPAGADLALLLARREHSRRKLVQRALRLRLRLRRYSGLKDADARCVEREGDLERRLETLRLAERDCELRRTRLELSERDLTTDRATLEREYKSLQVDVERNEKKVHSFQVQAERAEKELSAQRQAARAEIDQLRQELEQRRQQTGATAADPSPADTARLEERERLLKQRSRELSHYAQHLRKLQQARQSNPEEPAVGEAPQAVPVVVSVAVPAVEAAPSTPSPTADLLAEVQTAFRQQQAEMGALVAELRKLHEEAHAHSREELDLLKQENKALLKEALKKERQRALVSRTLEDRTSTAQEEINVLKASINELRREVSTKTHQIEKLRERQAEAGDALDIDSYEAELNTYRRQLEADRTALDEQIHQLQARTDELEEASREAELQLSRERAQMARDRTELIRLREEIRRLQDRGQRETGIRERLARPTTLRPESAPIA